MGEESALLEEAQAHLLHPTFKWEAPALQTLAATNEAQVQHEELPPALGEEFPPEDPEDVAELCTALALQGSHTPQRSEAHCVNPCKYFHFLPRKMLVAVLFIRLQKVVD